MDIFLIIWSNVYLYSCIFLKLYGPSFKFQESKLRLVLDNLVNSNSI